MKYFIDTEFHEYDLELLGKNDKNHTIELISIGIVREDGKEYYRIAKGFDLDEAWKNEWLKRNVLLPIFENFISSFKSKENPFEFCEFDFKYLIEKFGKTVEQIKAEILEFIGDDKDPQFYGYYCDYDWVVFCWLFGRMIDLPEHFPMYCRDLKQTFDEKVARRRLSELHSRGSSNFDLEIAKQLPNYPPQENEHNALADAKWNKSLYEFLQTL